MNPARPPGGFPLFGNYTAGKLLPKNTCLTEPLELEPVRFQRPYFGRPLCPFSRLTWRASFGTVASDGDPSAPRSPATAHDNAAEGRHAQ